MEPSISIGNDAGGILNSSAFAPAGTADASAPREIKTAAQSSSPKTSWKERIAQGFSTLPQFFRTQRSAQEKPSDSGSSAKEGGNAFTRIFSPTSGATSEEKLIENILAQSHGAQVETGLNFPGPLSGSGTKQAKTILAAEDAKKQEAGGKLQLAKVVLGSSLLIPLTSFLFGMLFVSPQGVLSGLLAEQNFGHRAMAKTIERSELQTEIATKKATAEELAQKITDIQDNKALQHIVQHRIAWREVFEKINAITDRAFEGNRISHYVTYQNYSGKVTDKSVLSVQGQVRDPRGLSWAAAIKLKDALNADENFSGVIITQFSKQPASTNSRITSSEYISPFSFQFEYLPEGKTQNQTALPAGSKAVVPAS